jgi:hypothetical protein
VSRRAQIAMSGDEAAAFLAECATTPELEHALRAHAVKRVALQFRELRQVTWDHRKLGGAD